jgi:hypothetical protein
MSRENMLTITQRLEAARARERRARAAAVRLQRALASAERRKENERKYLLGAALQAWAASDERVLRAAKNWLASYITRDGDRATLAGTPFEIPAPAAAQQETENAQA